MNINANVPTNSARSLEGAIRFGIVHSKDEIDTSADQVAPRSSISFGDGWRRGSLPPAGEANWVYSAATVWGPNLMPSAFATPAP
jgi:hypothetical protein